MVGVSTVLAVCSMSRMVLFRRGFESARACYRMACSDGPKPRRQVGMNGVMYDNSMHSPSTPLGLLSAHSRLGRRTNYLRTGNNNDAYRQRSRACIVPIRASVNASFVKRGGVAQRPLCDVSVQTIFWHSNGLLTTSPTSTTRTVAFVRQY